MLLSMDSVLVIIRPASVKFQIFKLPSEEVVNSMLLMTCMAVTVLECCAPWAY